MTPYDIYYNPSTGSSGDVRRPKVSPDQPSPNSQKIVESLVLLEFITDLYPNSTLLQKDTVLRAKAHFFIDAVSTTAYVAAMLRGEPVDRLLQAIEALQNLLSTEELASS